MSPISRAPSGPATTIGPSCLALHCLLLPRVQFNVSPASTSCKLPEGVEALSAPLNPIHGEVIPLHIGEFLPALQLGCSHSMKVLQMESFGVSCQPPVGEECRESCKAWLYSSGFPAGSVLPWAGNPLLLASLHPQEVNGAGIPKQWEPSQRCNGGQLCSSCESPPQVTRGSAVNCLPFKAGK